MLAEDDAVEKSMQESCLDIIYQNLIVVLSRQGQDNADAGKFGNRSISGAIVFRSLTEALSDKASLLFTHDNTTIWVILVSIDQCTPMALQPVGNFAGLNTPHSIRLECSCPIAEHQTSASG